MMMAFSAQALMWLLKRVVEKNGGEVTIETDDDMEGTILYFEGSDDGDKVTLKVVRMAGEGHA